jgi:ankyrin repeat protein
VHAVRSGDLETAKRLLARRSDPNLRLPDGSTLLSWAVENQDRRMVALLLRKKADPDGAADGGTSYTAPLLVACQYGDPQIIGPLLDAGANVNVSRPDGITPLALCAGSAPVSIVERLIAAGAAVDKPDAQGQTPLMWAAAKGRLDNIRVLIAHGAQVNRQTLKGFTPLFFALKSGEPRAPVAILEAGGDPDHLAADGTSAVQLSLYQKDYAFAAHMIERGADLTAFDRNGNTLLHAAVLANQPTLVRMLLARGANPNALTGPSKVELRYEVNYRSDDYRVPPKPPLLLAAENGFADVMRLLADAGADISYRCEDGRSIVHAAATSGRVAALDLALQLLPDPNVKDAHGQTPMHLLVQGEAAPETEAMMKLLAGKGARIDIPNRAGRTAADLVQDALTGVRAAFAATFGTKTASL